MSLFRAEWQKIGGNRITTALFVWIFPMGALVITVIAILLALFSADYRESQQMLGINPWDQSILFTWDAVNNPFGRAVILIFTAFVFATEYRHGTWKNLVTRRRRVTLILHKFLALGVYVALALVLMTLIYGINTGIVAGLIDVDYGLSNFGAAFGSFFEEYLLQMFVFLTGVFVVACFTALASTITKNVTTAALVGFLIYLFESIGIIAFAGLVQFLLNLNLFGVYRYLPTYNLENIASYLRGMDGVPVGFGIEGMNPDPNTLTVSVIILIAWVVGLIGLTVWRFQTQDITT